MFDIYKNKRVLITGHTGFKGSWLSLWLQSLGAEVLGYALHPETIPSMFNSLNIEKRINSVVGNILDRNLLEKTFQDFKPEFVFHLAAQPLVRYSYEEPVMTYETNVIGTLNVLEAARKCSSVKAFVNVTTDKCYENMERASGYKEDEPMGGYDMYSSSKGCVEIMSSSYRRCFLNPNQEGAFPMATARAGNVIGGGDWACDRLVPDCARFINLDMEIQIRHPEAIRPWQHVLEPLSGYLTLGAKLYKQGYEYAQGFNFGPEECSALTVEDIVKKIIDCWGKGEVRVYKKDNLHEAGLLMLNIEKARKLLGWVPIYNADEAIKQTVHWYKSFYNKIDMYDLTMSQIKDYEEKFNGKAASKSC